MNVTAKRFLSRSWRDVKFVWCEVKLHNDLNRSCNSGQPLFVLGMSACVSPSLATAQNTLQQFPCGCEAKSITGIDAAPIDSPTTPIRTAATTFHRSGGGRQRVSDCFGSGVDGSAKEMQAVRLQTMDNKPPPTQIMAAVPAAREKSGSRAYREQEPVRMHG